MTSEWDDRRQGGEVGPQFAQGQYDQQYPTEQYGQQYPTEQYGQQYEHTQGQFAHPPQPYPSPYGSPHGYASPPRSNVLGIVGLGIVVAATVLLVVLSWLLGKGMGEFLLELATSSDPVPMSEEELLADPRAQKFLESATVSIIGILFACLIGFAGWIVSIVATATKRGLGFGVAGIVLGIPAWWFGYSAFMLALEPVFEQLGG